ncbi:hypothetical protein LZK98_20425 [Sphingomonas cannabina]|uniref:hypothetical protein n=1 Tax=Sphingomonas cannabina TaxID=2899123 RepID=UPI001F1A1500|nr:hypothetical protein [Sphingomonas cannabina]UIJ45374.1 hypothetical protein LZK98_20425 [Sphingomonas cannabina]
MADTRSPRYPRISLLAAVNHTSRFYEEAHRSAIETDTAYKILGFSGKSGTSATVLGALRQYGLLEGLRGTVRISDLALAILEPSSNQEKKDALEMAAFKPEIFSEIRTHFSGHIPRSDEALRSYLIRNKDFSSSGAGDCIASLRQTISEIGTIAEEEVVDPNPARGTVEEPNTATAEISISRSPASDRLVERLTLSRTCNVELAFEGPLTETALNRLIQHIEIMKAVWTDEE